MPNIFRTVALHSHAGAWERDMYYEVFRKVDCAKIYVAQPICSKIIKDGLSVLEWHYRNPKPFKGDVN